jgi:hypothetical protein
MRAWKVFLAKKSELSLNTRPNIEIYNLENFLLDIENTPDSSSKLTFIPPYKSYIDLRSENSQQVSVKKNLTEEYIYKTRLYIQNLQRFYKGVIWLFTSDTLPSEENSW